MPKQSDVDTQNLELLLSLPLLMDLGLGVNDVDRSEWTLVPRTRYSASVLEPKEVVHWWPEPEILTTCVHQFRVDDFHSESANLLSAPEPVTMGASAPTRLYE